MNLKGRKILLVDDFVSIRKTIKKELILSGAKQVDEAGNGDDALKLLREVGYDAVLSDWNMPKKNGIELLKEVRSDKELHNTPVMLITAETNRDMVQEAIDHKVNDFLVKPFTLQLLMERLELLLNGNFATEQEIKALLNSPLSKEVLGLIDEQPNFEKATVLVVDDSADNLDVIVETLKAECQVKAANSAEVGRKILSKFKIDLILLDVMMPDEDGYAFCEWIKSEKQLQDIPILFLTAKDQPDDVAKGLMIGAVDYVTKPVHPIVLKARVGAHLTLKTKADSLRRQNIMLKKMVREKEDAERLMQHDLRNPLQAILLATENGGVDADIRSLIRDNAQQALDQVDQTLTIARLERGRQHLTRKELHLDEFIEGFRESMELLAKNHQVKLRWDTDFIANELVNVDKSMAQNMLSNLIRNAIEASDNGQVVHVNYEPANRTWRISNPTPVPESIRSRFFDKYVTSGKEDGNGMGTYIAKLIAHAHKGRIRLKTTSSGTEVEVEIGEPEG